MYLPLPTRKHPSGQRLLLGLTPSNLPPKLPPQWSSWNANPRLPQPAQSPSLCPHGSGPPLPCTFCSSSTEQSTRQAPHLCTTHKSFPLLFSSLHHPININSSFQTHLGCHLLGDACPRAHMRINHLFSMPGTIPMATPIIREAFCLLVSLNIW